MAFNNLAELKAAVNKRRQSTVTIEVDLGVEYSPEHEEAKKDLQRAEVLTAVVKTAGNGNGFLSDNIQQLKDRVEATRPAANSVFVRFKRLSLERWAEINRTAGVSAVDLYESLLPEAFVGLYGEDPSPDVEPDGWVAPEPLTTDWRAASFQDEENGLLPGGALNPVIQAFMAWQNSGGEVTIRPTKSGRV